MWIIVIRICFNKPKRSIEFHCVFHATQGIQLHSNIAFLTALLHNLFGQKSTQTSSSSFGAIGVCIVVGKPTRRCQTTTKENTRSTSRGA